MSRARVDPCPQGDSHNWGPGFPPISHLSLYGSSHVGLLGGIIRRTDDPAVLLWDCLRTDFFHDAAHPTFLAFNPYPRRRVPVEIDAGRSLRVAGAVVDFSCPAP